MSQRVVADLRYAQSFEVVAKWKGLLELIERPFSDNLKLSFACSVSKTR
jgi:hypothetical protein